MRRSLSGARFWRVDPAAGYGALNDVARHRINTAWIARHWDDLLRLAGPLKLGLVHPPWLSAQIQNPFVLALDLGLGSAGAALIFGEQRNRISG